MPMVQIPSIRVLDDYDGDSDNSLPPPVYGPPPTLLRVYYVRPGTIPKIIGQVEMLLLLFTLGAYSFLLYKFYTCYDLHSIHTKEDLTVLNAILQSVLAPFLVFRAGEASSYLVYAFMIAGYGAFSTMFLYSIQEIGFTCPFQHHSFIAFTPLTLCAIAAFWILSRLYVDDKEKKE